MTTQQQLDEAARRTHAVVRKAKRVHHLTGTGAVVWVAERTDTSVDHVLAMLDRGTLLGLRPVVGVDPAAALRAGEVMRLATNESAVTCGGCGSTVAAHVDHRGRSVKTDADGQRHECPGR